MKELVKVELANLLQTNKIKFLAKSPIFSHLTATLLGISTIRSRGLQPQLVKEFDSLQDGHSGTWQLATVAQNFSHEVLDEF